MAIHSWEVPGRNSRRVKLLGCRDEASQRRVEQLRFEPADPHKVPGETVFGIATVSYRRRSHLFAVNRRARTV